MHPLIEFAGAGYTYPETGVRAVAGVDVTIHQGEFVALVGANGSGKSTLARLSNGLLLPTEGTVRVAGQSTAEAGALWEIRRRVGIVWQDPDNQLVAGTVEEDVAFGPENLGLPPEEISRRVERALHLVGLQSLRERPVHTLSGGQKQLVAIAGVLAMEPDAVILDEATAMLDPNSRRQVLAIAQRLAVEQRVAVVMITHHMDEAAVAGRVIALAGGRVVFDGPPAGLLADTALLQRIGLDVPPLVLIARRLREAGVDVPLVCPQVENLADHLCRLS
ncbi:MAG: energy-coupling factor transporter ATPase [Bacillota bacterium]|nr:energy-coupling factor transporter ATPase [Bacillota bacterium]REJ36697.1 MAG: energy-coupling factor transporter ATPase [Bacillota bacterium]